jgi:hypothetical protein
VTFVGFERLESGFQQVVVTAIPQDHHVVVLMKPKSPGLLAATFGLREEPYPVTGW